MKITFSHETPITRGDSPQWQVPRIPEWAQQAALLHIVQSELRAKAELKKRKPKSE